jgi:hypothetical protein
MTLCCFCLGSRRLNSTTTVGDYQWVGSEMATLSEVRWARRAPGELHVSMSYVFFSRRGSIHQLYAQ